MVQWDLEVSCVKICFFQVEKQLPVNTNATLGSTSLKHLFEAPSWQCLKQHGKVKQSKIDAKHVCCFFVTKSVALWPLNLNIYETENRHWIRYYSPYSWLSFLTISVVIISSPSRPCNYRLPLPPPRRILYDILSYLIWTNKKKPISKICVLETGVHTVTFVADLTFWNSVFLMGLHVL